ncbi:MAG: hypothetical protein MZU95_14075 [Desulfomicrobium escambiense]|nr:hypothetical protein [Desulfomicrobium escambiense]
MGIAIGVMALIVVLSVMNGFEEDIKTKLLGTQSHIVISHLQGRHQRSLRPVMDEPPGTQRVWWQPRHSSSPRAWSQPREGYPGQSSGGSIPKAPPRSSG